MTFVLQLTMKACYLLLLGLVALAHGMEMRSSEESSEESSESFEDSREDSMEGIVCL